MPKPIALQLYSLREQNQKDFAGTLKLVADMGYVGVEFAGYYGLKAADARKLATDVGLKVAGAHTGIFDPAKVDQTIEDAKALGTTSVGGGFGPKDFESEDKIKAVAERVNLCVEKAAKAGLKAYLHNHWWEYDAPNKGELLLKLCPTLYAQFDIYWIQTGGADPAQLIAKYPTRVLSLHVKDGPCVQKEPMTAVGKGKVKTREAILAAEKTSCEWHIVELDACATDMVQAVRESCAFLVGNKLSIGRK